MNFAIYFRTLWSGRLVGQDDQGNKYYEDKRKRRYGKPRRWVIYKSYAEASKVPAGWHAWLHYTTDSPVSPAHPYLWEKEHLPNLTGTKYAHKPKGLKEQTLRKNYEPWAPR